MYRHPRVAFINLLFSELFKLFKRLFKWLFVLAVLAACNSTQYDSANSKVKAQAANEIKRQIPEVDSILEWSVDVDTITQKKMTAKQMAVFIVGMNMHSPMDDFSWLEDTTGYHIKYKWYSKMIDSCKSVMQVQDSVVPLFYLMTASAVVIDKTGFKKYAQVNYATDFEYNLLKLESLFNGTYEPKYVDTFVKPTMHDYIPVGVD